MSHINAKNNHAARIENFFEDESIGALLKSGKALSEDRFAKMFLKQINTGKLSANEWMSLRCGTDLGIGGGMTAMPDDYIESQRKWLSELLEHPSMIDLAVPGLLARISHATILVPDGIDEVGELTYRVITEGVTTGLNYALVLLLTKFREKLHQCPLPSCRKFFLTDSLKIKYCTEQHRAEFHQLNGAARTARYRERLAATKLKPRRRTK